MIMSQRIKVTTVLLGLFLGAMFLVPQIRQAGATEPLKLDPRCCNVTKKTDVVAEKAEKAAEEARIAAKELREKGTLEAAKKAAEAAKRAGNAAKEAVKVAQEAKAAGCFKAEEKAKLAAKSADSAAWEARNIITGTGETNRWSKEVNENVLPVASDPGTSEKQWYKEEGREDVVSPSQ
jgi:hypothetical protein